MTSPTKRGLEPAEQARLVTESFGPRARSSEWTELTDGLFNSAYRALVDRGDRTLDVVVKVAPRPGTPLLTYERDLMRTEALFHTLAARDTRVPVPALLHAGFDRQAIDGDYLVLSTLPGEPLTRAARRLSRAERRGLRAGLGAQVAALHRIRGDTFGYPQRPALQADTWPEAFAAMVDAVLDDARRFGVELPVTPAAVRQVVTGHAATLDAVATPVLTHFDLWDGNVFVAGRVGDDPGGGNGTHIAGLIDPERAFWGDPLADFVSLTLFRELTEDDPLVTGYRDAGGRLDLGAAGRRRLHLYRLYLDLVMLVEAVARAYEPAAHAPLRAVHESHLCRALEALTDPGSGSDR